mgnify:FL=1
MPQKRNSTPPPEVMTWPKAAPALVISVIFDALRLMFMGFIFFGPAMAGLFCTVKAGGSAAAGAVCTAAAGAAGFFGAPALIAFGTVMAMATGFAGWLFVGGWLMATNSRIFKENTLWFVGSLLFSEVPFIGAIPAITVSVWKMHSNQIKIEKAAYKKWEKENADAQAQERKQQIAEMQMRLAQREAANDAVYNQIQAANDEKYSNEEIPEDLQKAA